MILNIHTHQNFHGVRAKESFPRYPLHSPSAQSVKQMRISIHNETQLLNYCIQTSYLFWYIYAFKKTRNVLRTSQYLVEHTADQQGRQDYRHKLSKNETQTCFQFAYKSFMESSSFSASTPIRCNVPLIPSLKSIASSDLIKYYKVQKQGSF